MTGGAPTVLLAQTKRPDVELTVERRDDDGTWAPVASAATGSDGRAIAALDTSVAGPQMLRVTGLGTSSTITLTVSDGASCTPKPALVDPAATPEARCLATRLDRWRSAGLMGVGQQLNVSNLHYLDPVTRLGQRRVSVVGFDLQELADGETYQFADPPLDRLVQLARAGAVLSASWHPRNPHTGGSYQDRSWHDLGALLDPTTPDYQTFWADYAAKLTLFQRFQDAGVAVVFRPLHEANGDWFWWGHPKPATYRKVWSRLQERADDAGVHNIVWGYSFNADTGTNTSDPTRLLPAHVDLAGLDSYDPESVGQGKDALVTTGYAAVASEVRRMAITEAGPMSSADGAWKPSIISDAARGLRSRPAWAMLWYDDGDGDKQISSLRGGLRWLDSCVNAFCPLH